MGIGSIMLLFVTYSDTYNLPNGLLAAQCYVESHHSIYAVNPDDGHSPSLGICQIKLATARLMGYKGGATQLMEPKYNIKFAAKYLKHQIDRYDDIRQGVGAYNSGSFKLSKKGLPINQDYIRKVFTEWSKSK